MYTFPHFAMTHKHAPREEDGGEGSTAVSALRPRTSITGRSEVDETHYFDLKSSVITFGILTSV